ncbi:hypothetical protein AC481_03615 [miscellaneous Crenarchaeota group archaeon SMTZ-80]|nr:MAG: hypothetical protein AC481_03615 [miscellaneous Crenarchaeota group archaeon SMTZ-80]
MAARFFIIANDNYKFLVINEEFNNIEAFYICVRKKKNFKYISDILPSGPHIMIVYQNRNETKDGLAKGIPAPATPIEYLL